MNSYQCPLFAISLRAPSLLLFRFYLILTAFFLTMPGTASTTDTPTTAQFSEQQIIIPPFEVQTKKPHPHLQAGLANILATRVIKRTGYTLAPHSIETDRMTALLHQQDNAAVQKIIQNIDNTYLLAGTLKEKEKGYEITIHVFGHRPTAQISLSQTFNQLDRALFALDELSLNIAEKIFSIPRPKKTQIAAETGGLEGLHTAHPERFFKEKEYRTEVTTKPETKNTAFSIQ
ncbi:MAG: hypothetical protein D3903_02405 [Candidatus Electrothrix sp. GM3_4]|nr:hypothetical protein [Candidatus Electrothrix sp. GM3_4]